MSTSPLLLLFDIDGTLIDSGGAGGGALLEALCSEFALQNADAVLLHGRTDLGIMTELLVKHGIDPSPSNLQRLCERYFELLPTTLCTGQGHCLPGVHDLLIGLQHQPDSCLALLTGNMPQSAQMKLQHFGLWEHFEFGIFGDLASERPDLATPAVERIQQHCGGQVELQRVVIVGDTPLDIALARRMGVLSLGVCTGGVSKQKLLEAGASHAVDNLADTQGILHWLNRTTMVQQPSQLP